MAHDILQNFRPKGPFRVYLEDLINDTIGWPDDTRFKYVRLLNHMWTQGGWIPDDDDYIAEVIGLFKARGWKKTVEKLRSKLVTNVELTSCFGVTSDFLKQVSVLEKPGFLTQKRLMKDMLKALEISQKRSEARKPKAKKQASIDTTNDTTIDTTNDDHSLLSTSTVYSSDTNVSDAEASADQKNDHQTSVEEFKALKPPGGDFRKLLFDHGLDFLQSVGSSQKSARSVVGKWLKQSGDNPERVWRLLADAHDDGRADPVPWMMACLNESEPEKPDWFNDKVHYMGQDGMTRLKENNQRAGGP